MIPHWKVLLVGLAGHGSLIRKLMEEGHEIQVTDDLSEACLYVAAYEHDLIIIHDDEDHPHELLTLFTWLADGASPAQVIQLTHWRVNTQTPTQHDVHSPASTGR